MDQWDPIGVKDEPNAADEYDGYLGDILLLLKHNASVEEIAITSKISKLIEWV